MSVHSNDSDWDRDSFDPQTYQGPNAVNQQNIVIIPLEELESGPRKRKRSLSNKTFDFENQSVKSTASHRYKNSVLVESNAVRKREYDRKKSTLQLSYLIDDFRVEAVQARNQMVTEELKLGSNFFEVPQFNNFIQLEQEASTQLLTHTELQDPRKYSTETPQTWRKSKILKQRVDQISTAIENDDVEQFKHFKVTFEEMIDLRFDLDMNLLQLVCHEQSVTILNYIAQTLENEQTLKEQMVTHRDSHLGSQAIHLAAATGNYHIIDSLIFFFGADVKQITNEKQTVHHCASQRYDGIAAIFLFKRIHKIDVTTLDDKGATPLHFAAISLHIKNVQSLIKLGADTNVQDIEGNSPMHLAIEQIYEDPENNFEKVKNIVKELIFSGAKRELKNNSNQQPIDMIKQMVSLLDADEYNKICYILTPPTGFKYFRMTRPIEKVTRGAGCQRATLLLNLAFISVFVCAGILNFHNAKQYQSGQKTDLIVLSIACLFFLCTILFYFLTIMLDPGYVKKQPNFLSLLKRLIAENYHLDYVCVPCETLRPENAEHCNFCNWCVQKFDHHCIFVNNCLGYRNHKYFLLFLLCYTIFLIGVVAHALVLIYKFCTLEAYRNLGASSLVLNWLVQILLLLLVLLHSPILFLQIKSQIGKLFKLNENEGVEESQDEITTSSEFAERGEVSNNIQDSNESRWSSFKTNVGNIFSFKPQSQEQLYGALFGGNEQQQTERISLNTLLIDQQQNNRVFNQGGIPGFKWMKEQNNNQISSRDHKSSVASANDQSSFLQNETGDFEDIKLEED